jgi:hypothetical protein
MPTRHIFGYTRKSVRANIVIAAHNEPRRSQEQNVRIAFEIARKAWRHKYPKGPLPEHLRGVEEPSKNRVRGDMKILSMVIRRVPAPHGRRPFALAIVEYRDGQGLHVVEGDARGEVMQKLLGSGSAQGQRIHFMGGATVRDIMPSMAVAV